MSSLVTLNYLLKATVAVGVNRSGHADAFDVALTKFNESMMHLSVANQETMTGTQPTIREYEYVVVDILSDFHACASMAKTKVYEPTPPGATVATHSVHNEEKRHGTSCYILSPTARCYLCVVIIDNKVAFN